MLISLYPFAILKLSKLQVKTYLNSLILRRKVPGRSFLNSLACIDVPVLYSPKPFKNASLFVLEVKCKQIKRAAAILEASKGRFSEENADELSSGVCYNIEINDTVIPPWVVHHIFEVMSSEGRNFEASCYLNQANGSLHFLMLILKTPGFKWSS
ncbi:hypothetical protein AMTR_s00083p00039080 [Amborella trichopoda]|uniref:Uncharacterized protein n=1 Tax=Amborella trichopoda TaxID=13333 RepID=W1P4J2_AMBTC|nr:hypothetical protein AMTR_s00083p00039080 [Amborella trichopoda]